jgi:hypothetical protein
MARTSTQVVSVRFIFRDESGSLSQVTFYQSASRSFAAIAAQAISLAGLLQSVSGASIVQMQLVNQQTFEPVPPAQTNAPIFICAELIFNPSDSVYANITIPALRTEFRRSRDNTGPGIYVQVDSSEITSLVTALVAGPWRDYLGREFGGEPRAVLSIRPDISLVRTLPF